MGLEVINSINNINIYIHGISNKNCKSSTTYIKKKKMSYL